MKHLFFVLMLVLPSSLLAADNNDDEFFDYDQRYQRVSPAQPTANPDKIEVVELFWYGCPHCYDFEPILRHWLETKPDHVEFRRLPAIFRDNWAPHARAYFTAELLGIVDKIHQPLFDAIHKEKRRLNNREALMAFFAERGVSNDEFSKVYDSFAVESKVRNAAKMSRRYGIRGVPAVIVNGKYRTSGSTAGTYDNVLKVIDHLVDKEMQARTGK